MKINKSQQKVLDSIKKHGVYGFNSIDGKRIRQALITLCDAGVIKYIGDCNFKLVN